MDSSGETFTFWQDPWGQGPYFIPECLEQFLQERRPNKHLLNEGSVKISRWGHDMWEAYGDALVPWLCLNWPSLLERLLQPWLWTWGWWRLNWPFEDHRAALLHTPLLPLQPLPRDEFLSSLPSELFVMSDRSACPGFPGYKWVQLQLTLTLCVVREKHWPLQHWRLLWRLKQERICLQCRRLRFDPWMGKISWRREWLPTPVFWSVKSHGQSNLAGYTP